MYKNDDVKYMMDRKNSKCYIEAFVVSKYYSLVIVLFSEFIKCFSNVCNKKYRYNNECHQGIFIEEVIEHIYNFNMFS
jgi:hypothetical protein